MQPPKKQSIKTSKKKVFIFTSIITFLVLLGAFGYNRTQQNNKETSNETNSPQTVDTIEQVNLNPPSDEIINETEDYKNHLGEPAEPEIKDSDNDKKSITPVITSAGVFNNNVEVSAYVPGVLEKDGKCTALFNQNGVTIEKVIDAIPDVGKMLCPTISFPRSNHLVAGVWNVTVAYQSSHYNGTSESKTFDAGPMPEELL